MRVVVVGGTGTIGQAVVKELSQRHEVISVGHSKGDLQVNIADLASIKHFYQQLGSFDALLSTTGKVAFADFQRLSDEQIQHSIQDKLLGQVNLVKIGCQYINAQGSFTLTSGILNHDPIIAGSMAGLVNGALEGFVRSVAIELPKGIRINLVSPTVITESLAHYGPYFRGFESVSAARAALAYSKSAEGAQTGQVYRVGY
jgi:NAD(P)-dependent dehydrogenase (short-subunit alcohol dehydrogenase family)